MFRDLSFRSAITSLWFRLVTLGIVGLIFAEVLVLAPGTAQGWSFYLTIWEVIFEIFLRLIFAALAGVALGTICVALLAPFLWYFKASRERLAQRATQVAVFLVVFLDSWFALKILIKWSYQLFYHRAIFDTVLFAALFLAFALALCIPRYRETVVTSLDGCLGETMTRRAVLATVAGTAALVVTEFALGKTVSAVQAALPSPRPKSNILLITFDALSAEDMSLYGYRLPTTPNIEAFARKSTVFKNFFSCSTFTTSSVATMLTGIYPSETQVYQLQGQIRVNETAKSLPHLMRAGGYTTVGFMSNPFAYYLAKGLQNEFDLLPEPTFQQGGLKHLWDATTPLHQDSRFGCRIDEYLDLESVWNNLGGMPTDLAMRFRAAASFEHAQELLPILPDGFFLWVHVMTPHDPYLPDAQDRGRFLPDDELRTFEDESGARWRPHYPPDQQAQVDRRRLGYDEFVATADRAFGTFMSQLENSGKLQNTTVLLSADHGESFEGGVYQHRIVYQTRPLIHVPLIVRTPGQQEGRTVAVAADQTSLPPTILELAGQPQPEWMRSPSLAKWLNGTDQGEGEGLAFCQYFEKNSVFKPLHHGSVGVIDGQYQYLVYLDTQKGVLRPLSEAQIWNADRSAEDPARAEALRAVIHSRFPDLVQKTT